VKKCVLLIACDPADALLVVKALTRVSEEGLDIEGVTTLSGGVERISKGGVLAVILDLEMPDHHGIAGFEQLFSAAPDIPILLLSGTVTESTARQALERGAQDYIPKNHLDEFRLRRVVRGMIERKAAVDTAFRQQQRAEVTLSCTGDAVLTTDTFGQVTELNRAAETLTGWTGEEAIGHKLADVFQIMDGITRQPVQDLLTAVVNPENSTLVLANHLLIRRDGLEVAIEDSAAPTRDRRGNVSGAVIVFHDVSAARAKTLELSHRAQHDFLTDLPNRVLLNDRINQAISFAARYSKQLAVMFVDLDYFKKINDAFGHAVGDKLLQAVATRLVTCVRRSDTVSRLGGDEFAVLLSQVERAEDAVFSAKKILSALAAPYSIDQKHLDINASIGVSTYPSDGRDAETLIQKADTAMYDAKKLGRNSYQFFRADMQARVLERQRLETALRSALGRDELRLNYQPKIDLKTGEITGVEALLRWHHPDRGLIPPSQFIPIAEESGLIIPIGQWVLLQACRQARAWMDAGLPAVRVAVNVSALQFMAKDFLSCVRAVLISTGVDPHNLELELTETVLMQDAESAVEKLHALKAIGVQLAVDDFGIGYSSFSYLRRFPLDALKVDRTFIKDLSADAGAATIVAAMINIGKSLHHRVIAEGVETREQLHFLQEQGCGEGQGYFFCHPVIAEKFAQFLESGLREYVVH
jgi:diguanylate cyclase (GGDEF)-like protein/PAS domain S-box-containing protein